MPRLKRWTSLLVLISCLTSPPFWSRAAPPSDPVNQSIAEADELLEQFQFHAGLKKVDNSLELFPASPRLHKKRADILMLLGRNQEALASYRQALTLAPNWLEGHWALWALFNRLSVDPELELDSLFHIAGLDSRNPLAQIRVARKLREQKRFEESAVYFRRAVEINPTHLAYRLFLARALFDIREVEAAKQEVQRVLSHAAPGSPEHIAAKNLRQIVEDGTVDMGARTDIFQHTKQPYGLEGKDYKRWALTRGDAWQFMMAGNFPEAETAWRYVLTLDPEDDLARYNLGLTLMKLGKYEDARIALQASLEKSKQPPFYPDAVFQIGQAYANLEQWENAVVYYQQAIDMQHLKEQDFYAMNFPDLQRVEAALLVARTHVTNVPPSQTVEATPTPPHLPAPTTKAEPPTVLSPDSFQKLPEGSQTPLRVLPLSVDVVRGWFRQLVTAQAISQNDIQAGFHEFIPLDPGDTFPLTQPRIYLVFDLTTPPSGTKQIATQWVAEEVEEQSPHTVIGTDVVLVGLSDSLGYFFLDQPEGGWAVGTYRIDLFVGEEISPYTYVADVRFRITDRPSKGRLPEKEVIQ